MAEETERQRLRLDLGFAADDTTNLPDATLDAVFAEAGESYTDAASIKAATRILMIDRLMIQAAADVDYQQNENSRKASQRYTMLGKERAKWEQRLEAAIAATNGSSARFGRSTRKPARLKEYPPTWGW